MLHKYITPRVEQFFAGVGWRVASRPKLSLALVAVIASLFTLGTLNLTTENRSDRLWVPQSAESYLIREQYLKDFGDEASFATLFVQSQTPDGDVFDYEHLSELMNVTLDILSLEAMHGGVAYNYSDLCVRRYIKGPCSTTNILDAFGNDLMVLRGARDMGIIKQILSAVHATKPLDAVVAGMSVSNSGEIKKAEALISHFELSPAMESGPLLSWQKAYLDYLATYDFQYLSIGMIASRSFDDEISRVVFGDISLFIIALFAMLAYLSATLGYMNWVQSRVLLSFGALAILMLSVGAAFGMLGITGVKFNSICILMPFMLLGVGVDDIIVVVDNLERVEKYTSIPDRVSKALSHAGTAITLTSVTAVIAFLSGSFVDMPGVASFCVVSSCAFFFNFVFQVIGFTALLALDEQRRISQRNSLFPCIKAKTVSLAALSRDLEGPETAEADNIVAPEGASSEQEGDTAVRVFSGCVSARKQFHEAAGQIAGVTDRLVKFYFTPFVLDTRVRIGILVAFAGLFVGAAASLTSIAVGLPQVSVVPDDSYIVEAFDLLEDHWPERIFTTAVIFGDMDLRDPSIRGEVVDFLDWSAEQDWYVRPTESWLLAFQTWVTAMHAADPVNNPDLKTLDNSAGSFYQALETFLDNDGRSFKNDIIFGEDGKSIEVSRQYLSIKTSLDTSIMFEFMQVLLARVREGNLNGDAYHLNWLFAEIDDAIPDLTMQNLLQALIAIFVCLCFFIPVNKSFVVCFVVVLIDIDILGLMAWWGIRLNAVSFVCLVMSVGLSVDYCVHVTHAFEHASGNSLKRAEWSLNTMGVSVMKGGFTTFLGIIILAFASSDAFRTFFKMLFGIVTLGLAHGLLFLPVVLSFIGGSHYPVAPAPKKYAVAPADAEGETPAEQQITPSEPLQTHPSEDAGEVAEEELVLNEDAGSDEHRKSPLPVLVTRQD